MKIKSKFGVDKCKFRTAAERQHNAPEMPAHAFRLVNTSVFSTSSFSVVLKKTHECVSGGYHFLNIFVLKMCLKLCLKQLRFSTPKKDQKRTKTEPKSYPENSPKTPRTFQHNSWTSN